MGKGFPGFFETKSSSPTENKKNKDGAGGLGGGGGGKSLFSPHLAGRLDKIEKHSSAPPRYNYGARQFHYKIAVAEDKLKLTFFTKSGPIQNEKNTSYG